MGIILFFALCLIFGVLVKISIQLHQILALFVALVSNQPACNELFKSFDLMNSYLGDICRHTDKGN